MIVIVLIFLDTLKKSSFIVNTTTQKQQKVLRLTCN